MGLLNVGKLMVAAWWLLVLAVDLWCLLKPGAKQGWALDGIPQRNRCCASELASFGRMNHFASGRSNHLKLVDNLHTSSILSLRKLSTNLGGDSSHRASHSKLSEIFKCYNFHHPPTDRLARKFRPPTLNHKLQ